MRVKILGCLVIAARELHHRLPPVPEAHLPGQQRQRHATGVERRTTGSWYLNVGDAAARTARNIGRRRGHRRDRVHRADRLGRRTAPRSRSRRSAGRNTYAHVDASITGIFGDGVDNVTIDPSVQVPVTIDGG